MSKNSLHVISAQDKGSFAHVQHHAPGRRQRDEQQATMEREWLRNPGQFDPQRNCLERERIRRTLAFIQRHCDVKDKAVADLGCGLGTLAKALHEQKASSIHALDIAANALKLLQKSCDGEAFNRIKAVRDALPDSKLPDSYYDIVLCCDVIAYLNPNQYRLLFSELTRVAKSDGWIICSTPIDCKTEAPWRKFSELAQTELVVEEWLLSYHRMYYAVTRVLQLPSRYMQIASDPSFRQSELEKCCPVAQRFLRFFSSRFFTPVWKLVRMIVSPLHRSLEKNNWLLLCMESLSRTFWDEAAITHAIAIGKRRPILPFAASAVYF